MTRKRPAKSPEYAVSDEAAAYIADALMELALQFEAAGRRSAWMVPSSRQPKTCTTAAASRCSKSSQPLPRT
jgi:hypothetical protein